MGSESLVFGRIEGTSELYFTKRFYDEINRGVICSLPESDIWPELTRDFFSMPNEKHIYRTQIICFGASFNKLEIAWEAWLEKLENLLKKLYWEKVELYLESEIVRNYAYSWVSTETERLASRQIPIPAPVSNWLFEGGPRNFNDFLAG